MNQRQSRTAEALPPPPATFHFIGIGGIGMSALARILLMWGHKVTGSDAVESTRVLALREMGIPVVIGHDDPTFAGLADIVVTNKRAAANARTELDAAAAAGARVIKRGDLLGMAAGERICIAVAGSHGKSTTSSMLSVALRHLDQDPTFAVGAIVAETGTNAEPGEGPHFVVEADEFDRSFHGLFPNVAIVTSVAFDHPDIYADQAEYDEAFVEFVRNVQPDGTLVLAADDPGCHRLKDAIAAINRPDIQVVTFGDGGEWQVQGAGYDWKVTSPDGASHAMRLRVPGMYNARNAVAGIAALVALGLEMAPAIAAMSAYTGIARRFEHKGTVNGVDVIDDYAHHPEEIEALLKAAREAFPGRRIVAVHQPHTYSRTHALMREFASSLQPADVIVLLDIYGVGEENTHNVSSRQMAHLIPRPVQLAADPVSAVACVRDIMQPGDVVLTIGAGSVTSVGAMLVDTQPTPEPKPAAVQSPSRTRPLAKGGAGTRTDITIPDAAHLRVTSGASMSLYTTMRIGGAADFLVRCGDADDIIAASRWAHDQGLPVNVIGGGSNLLVSDAGLPGLVIVARTPGEKAASLVDVQDDGDAVILTVGAQAPLSWVGRYAAENGWQGMDWGVGLPGQVGGATVNNAGAHGTEMKDHLVAVDVLLEDGSVERFDASWMEPAYRITRIKGAPRPRPWTLLRSVLRLPKGDANDLVRLADEHAEFRRRTQPTGACSGSTFANPEGDFAGRLIEAAGLKGHRHGAMQMSPKHANWAMNTGGASANEAWELICLVRERVQDQFGVELHPEVERVGEFAR